MVLIKSETLKVTISVAEQTCLIYKQTALNKKKNHFNYSMEFENKSIISC